MKFPIKLSIRIAGSENDEYVNLLKLGELIMSAISDFATIQATHNGKIDAAVTGLQGDIQSLNDKIAELQNTPGTITAEDQALLDDIQSRSEAVATKLEALDALTPPTVPAV